jgi:aryl-alcohol dehydrogenase-like predicted oxidoreductase
MKGRRVGQRLALGTAQIGLDYGVTNMAGRIPDTEVSNLLSASCASGLSLLDTAPGYGDSEDRLGRFTAQAACAWEIMTKTPAARSERITAAEIGVFEASWQLSRERLGPGPLHALLVHHAEDLLAPGGEALHDWLCSLRACGQVTHIGVSVYDRDQIDALFSRFGAQGRPFDIVQLPASIADQRLCAGTTLRALHELGVQLHVRSLYLQGLLLAKPEFVDARFPGKGDWLRRLRQFCADHGLSPVQACLSFFKSSFALDVAVVGATNVKELLELKQGFDNAPVLDWRDWADNDSLWVDPRRWRTA